MNDPRTAVGKGFDFELGVVPPDNDGISCAGAFGPLKLRANLGCRKRHVNFIAQIAQRADGGQHRGTAAVIPLHDVQVTAR